MPRATKSDMRSINSIHSFAGFDGYENGSGKMPAQGEESGRIAHLVDLVEDDQHLVRIGAEIGQDAHGGVVELHHLRLRGIEYVDQKIGERGFLERGVEGFDQLMREFAHEADGVGEQQRLLVRQGDLARGGIERGEEFVLDENVGPGEPMQERGFADIGVADNGGVRNGRAFSIFPLGGA